MSYSETITKADLENVLNEVLPPIGSAILYNGTKVSSGTLTLNDAYTNYDFLVISYHVNTDNYTRVFDCGQIANDSTSYYNGDISLNNNGTIYASNCTFKPTDGTHFTVSNFGNNANFVAGIVKIVGITSHDAKSGIAMDYIVEQGTNSNGTYRKWNSGILEQWGQITTSASSGNVQVDITFPVAFIDTTYNVQLTSTRNGVASGFLAECSYSSGNRNATTTSTTVSWFKSGNAYATEIKYFVIGRWK